MPEVTYKEVASSFKQCSLQVDSHRRCNEPASYAINLHSDGWYWRCAEHKAISRANADGTLANDGAVYSRYYPAPVIPS
jgi:hypothetical protein